MDRQVALTKYVAKEKVGIEIGPWFSPIAPKRAGYQCYTLDVFDFDTLLAKANVDPFIPKDKIANIETVDLVGSSVEIATLAANKNLLGRVDYILSSHNFEHLPNPIRFLQGCDQVLKPGGMLTMAIPDLRTTFDYFRPISTLADWLDAYFSRRERPTYKQIFEQSSVNCRYQKDGDINITFPLSDDPTFISPLKTLAESFARWQSAMASQDMTYHDAHCSTFTPASFELLISDLNFLGLTKLQLIEVSETQGCEFFAYLHRLPEALPASQPDLFYEQRKVLLHRVINERSCNSLATFHEKIARQQAEIERQEAAAALTVANEKVQALQTEIDRLNNESDGRIQQLESLLDKILTSMSWRATSPFRSILEWLQRLKANVILAEHKKKY